MVELWRELGVLVVDASCGQPKDEESAPDPTLGILAGRRRNCRKGTE